MRYGVINPQTDKVEHATAAARSLLTVEGIRFMYTGFVPNLMGFTALGVIIVAMVGVGVAEGAGLVDALIRKLVAVSPRWALCYILVLVGWRNCSVQSRSHQRLRGCRTAAPRPSRPATYRVPRIRGSQRA